MEATVKRTVDVMKPETHATVNLENHVIQTHSKVMKYRVSQKNFQRPIKSPPKLFVVLRRIQVSGSLWTSGTF